MLAKLSGAGLEYGSAVSMAGCSSLRARVPAAMPAEPGRTLSGTQLLGLGVFLAVVVAVPLIAGLLVDGAAHSSPLGLLIGLLLGIVGAGFCLWAQVRRYL